MGNTESQPDPSYHREESADNSDSVDLNLLALKYYNSFQESNQTDDLDEAITHSRKAFRLCSPSHPDYAMILGNLAVFVNKRFQLRHAMDDLAEVITLRREAIPFYPAGHPDRFTNLNNLALALCSRFNALDEVEDLQNAVTYIREALLSCPPENPGHPTALRNLGLIISDCFDNLRKMKDPKEIIAFHREYLLLCPPTDNLDLVALNNLARKCYISFQESNQTDFLDEAIVYGRKTKLLCSPSHPDYVMILGNLAVFVESRFKLRHAMDDLAEVITLRHEAIPFYPAGHPDRFTNLVGLAFALRSRFNERGEVEDVQNALTYIREALLSCPPENPGHPTAIGNLGLLLDIRFGQLGNMEDLEEAITCHRQSRRLCLDFFYSGNLALALFTRFRQLGTMGDLDEAIAYNEEALDLCTPGDPARGIFLNNRALFLSTRYECLGKLEDLEGAIACQRESLNMLRPEDPEYSMSLSNFACYLLARFHQLGNIGDLDEAIKYNREALFLCPAGNPGRFVPVNNLAGVLLTRFEMRSQETDLVDVHAYMREALDLCPPGNIRRASALNNLARLLHDHSDGIADLDNAIAYNQEALDLRPPGNVDRWMSLDHLALALSTRFEKLRKVDDLKNAIAYHFQAEEALPRDHPQRALLGVHIASTYLLQYQTNRTLEHLTMAFDRLKDAANHRFAGPKAQLDAALQWVSKAREYQHSSSLEAYSRSLIALDRCLATRLSIESQQQFLTTTPKSLALDAAACAIAGGELKRAVELLEQGRAVVWARLRGYRHSLEKLHEIDSKLAEDFQKLSAQLEQYATSSDVGMKVSKTISKPTGPPVSIEEKMEQHRILTKEWDDVVSRIREKEGFTDFLLPIPFTTLQQAAKEGPVIVVNIGTDRSDAIILCRDSRPPDLVPLPDASPQNLARLSTQLSEARAGDAVDCPKIVYGVLRTLWEVVVLPVRDKLAELNVGERTRIWWCPTSELCGLPLHAAGPYSSGKKNFPDIYVSSYTPSLSALISARAGKAGAPTIPKMLVISQPGASLPQVNNEISMIQKFHSSLTILSKEGATPKAVLSSLSDHSWAHFACHGIQDPKPYKSKFILHDNEDVTLLDLVKARLPDAEFAFLSACHSAAGDLGGTPDEIIHLAAALQFCGFRSVVGTLWAMGDLDAPDMAQDFYKYMFRRPGGTVDFRDSAVALNWATRQMRGRRVPVDRWINFVHIGA